MLAVEFSSGRVALAERPIPRAQAGQVLVRVARVGICGTDLGAVQRGNPRFADGVVIGHELVGERLDTGARVTVVPLKTCGSCTACRTGRENLCAQKVIIGAHTDGVLAEYVAVPEELVIELPRDVTDAQAALIEPMATALHALRRPRIEPGSRVAVIGAGAIGLCLLAAARASGAAAIELAEIDASKHRHAARLGADVTGVVVSGVHDAVFDTVGAPGTRENAIAQTAPGGATVFVGLHSRAFPLDGNDVVTRERTLYGSFAYSHRDFVDAVELVRQLSVDWVTEVPVGAAADLINGTTSPPVGTTKLHVVLDSPPPPARPSRQIPPQPEQIGATGASLSTERNARAEQQ